MPDGNENQTAPPRFPPPVQPQSQNANQPEETEVSHRGAIRLFKVFGITVFLHWSWFLIAIYEISDRSLLNRYSSPVWNALEYLALFGLVLLHELGHSLAARQVGGKADHILLWPLGGIAYVRLPSRPGATLWGIFAGPLVNIVFVGVFYSLNMILFPNGRPTNPSDTYFLLYWLTRINIALLVFNLLPIYPLDGGQIFRSLLWFILGQGPSLVVAAVFGILGAISMVLLAFWWKIDPLWICVMAIFISFNCWSGLKNAFMISRINKILRKVPRHKLFACPECGENPPTGPFWQCEHCNNRFDPFQNMAVCPHCSKAHALTYCPFCGARTPINSWLNMPIPDHIDAEENRKSKAL